MTINIVDLDKEKKLLEESMNRFQIPKRMQGGITRWIMDGIRPGDFLTGIITNNLLTTFSFADIENKDIVDRYVNFFYNSAPIACWGNNEKVRNWKGIVNEQLSHHLSEL